MTATEHAVIIYFSYGSKDLSRLFALEDKISAILANTEVGEFDGNEMAADGSHGTLYMYGPDADSLFHTVKPLLEATEFMQGARVRLHYGPPRQGIREVQVVLGN